MNRRLRQRHLWMVILLGVVALAVLIRARMDRKPIPPIVLPEFRQVP